MLQADTPTKGWHRRQQLRFVLTSREAGVEDRDDAAVGAPANQTPGALREDERGRGNVNGEEGVRTALLGAGATSDVHGVVRDGEWDLVDHDEDA